MGAGHEFGADTSVKLSIIDKEGPLVSVGKMYSWHTDLHVVHLD